MRNTRVEAHEDVLRNVFAVGNDHPAGLVLALHSHKRCQCLYAITGVLAVTSSEGSWLVPPRRALWIPSGIDHEVRMSGPTTTRSAYISLEAARAAGLPGHCTVISVSPLLHELLSAAVDVPKKYQLGGHDDHLMQLLIEEIAEMPELPLSAPLPREPRMVKLCRDLLQTPTLESDVDTAARQVGMSRRNFTRLFREQTGMSFCDWRQQACLLTALTRLSLGASVTEVAMELGYSTSSAFTVSFRRVLGFAPRQYLSGTRG